MAHMEDVPVPVSSTGKALYTEPYDPRGRWSASTRVPPSCWRTPGILCQPVQVVRNAKITNTGGRAPATCSWPVIPKGVGDMWPSLSGAPGGFCPPDAVAGGRGLIASGSVSPTRNLSADRSKPWIQSATKLRPASTGSSLPWTQDTNCVASIPRVLVLVGRLEVSSFRQGCGRNQLKYPKYGHSSLCLTSLPRST